MRNLAVAVLLGSLIVIYGCVGGHTSGAVRTSGSSNGVSSRPIPQPVFVRQAPDGVRLADPRFESLPGAHATFGQLGGTIFQIEVPDRWNRRLVLWMHGFQDFGPQADVSPPKIRAYLVAQGYAWAASSFSSTSWIPGRAADETSALWDYFSKTHGRPERTYVIGQSMGGAAANIAAERYANRLDGVLALCGSAGASAGSQDLANLLVAGAYLAGVSQAEFEASSNIGGLIRDRIRPSLQDPQRRNRFERIMVALTGGSRPFDREGFQAEEDTNWRRAELAVSAGVIPPRLEPYHLGPPSDVSDAEFNRVAIRLHTNDDHLRAYAAGNDASGAIRVPLLTIHTTGDGQVPIEEARILQRLVNNAGARNLLVQRVVRDPSHCGFTNTETVASFEALVNWVEHGRKPTGNNVLAHDLANLRPSFELQPRGGTPNANRVPGAHDRVVVRGTATVDGRALDARFFGADVVHDGLTAHCQLGLSSVHGGAFEVTVRAETEAAGCGTAGARIIFWAYTDRELHSTNVVLWPGNGTHTTSDVRFSTSAPQGTAPPVAQFVGEVLGSDGRYVPSGTRIEAFIGPVRCGVTSTGRTGNFSGYSLDVAGPDTISGCEAGAVLTFRVDGRLATQSAPSDVGHQHSLDLTVH